MKFKFPSIEKYLKEDDIVIQSNEQSKTYVSVPELIGKYGSGLSSTLKMRKNVFGEMAGCLYEAKKGSAAILKNPNMGKKEISAEELEKLENHIKSLGIDLVGYAKVTPDLIFKDHKILYDHAIVVIMEMKKEEMVTAPSKRGLKEVFRTYYSLGATTNKIAEYLRANGFNSMAGPAIGGDVSYVPLAQKAGLGEIGKHGLLITDKNLGPSFRIAAIYVDIENLPFPKENPHSWIKDFCQKCGKCIKLCPGQAIYEMPSQNGECIDVTKCAIPFANNYGCSVCIKNCSFFNNDYEKLKIGFTKNNK